MSNDDPTDFNDAPIADEEQLIDNAAGALAGSTLDDPDHLAGDLDA